VREVGSTLDGASLRPSEVSTRALGEWATREPGRSMTTGESIDRPRTTVTVVYRDVPGSDAREAQADGKLRFLEECDVVGWSAWESVLA
jgi:hypothetical protein